MKQLAITPLSKPVSVTIEIPGSKSYTNRALLLAAMTPEIVTLQNHLLSDDTEAMMECLQTLGIQITATAKSVIVSSNYRQIKNMPYILNARISGTTLRFLLPFCALIPGVKTIGGEDGLNKRPIAPLVQALADLGTQIAYVDKEGFPPLKISSSQLKTHEVTMQGEISSQYFSALLMAAPLANGLTIKVAGQQISKPYIDMTISSMADFGVKVSNHDYQVYEIAPGQAYSASNYTIEGDYSSAGYLFAIAALTKSTITLTNLNPHSAQADRKLLDVLSSMGNVITSDDRSVTIQGAGIKAQTINVISFPDQAQTLAVLAAFAKGSTVLKGVQSLRVKETERVVALQQELAKMGIKTEATHDTLTIHGGNPKPATIDTYGDHRMAMSFAIAGSVLPGMIINQPDVVAKTFPTFWKVVQDIGMEVHQYE